MSNITISNKAQLGQEPSLFKSRWDTSRAGTYGKLDSAGSPNDTIVLPITSDRRKLQLLTHRLISPNL